MNKLISALLTLSAFSYAFGACDDLICYNVYDSQTFKWTYVCETVVCESLPSGPDNPPSLPINEPAPNPEEEIYNRLEDQCRLEKHSAKMELLEMYAPNTNVNVDWPSNGRWGNTFRGTVGIDSQQNFYMSNAKFALTFHESPGVRKVIEDISPGFVYMYGKESETSGMMTWTLVGSAKCGQIEINLGGDQGQVFLEGTGKDLERRRLGEQIHWNQGRELNRITDCSNMDTTHSWTSTYTIEFNYEQSLGASVVFAEVLAKFGLRAAESVTVTHPYIKTGARQMAFVEYPVTEYFQVQSIKYDWLGQRDTSTIMIEGDLERTFKVIRFEDRGPCIP